MARAREDLTFRWEKWPRSFVALAALAVLGSLGCTNGASKSTAAKDGAADSDSDSGVTTLASKLPPKGDPAANDGSRDGGKKRDEETHGVFPVDSLPPNPTAERLCKTLHDVPEARRVACCADAPGVVVTSECVRTLTTALADKTVTVTDGDVEACSAALTKAYEGCDWVGPFPPALPAPCQAVVHGTVARGKACRSTLECSGADRCLGLSPTTAGKCGTVQPDGERCGSTVDPLATFLRLGDMSRERPECTGYCHRFKCASFTAAGEACTISRECGEGSQCIAKKCVARKPSKLGEKCPGGSCAEGLECILGTCGTKKAAGAACTVDFECVGGCVKTSAAPKAVGVCGKKCGTR